MAKYEQRAARIAAPQMSIFSDGVGASHAL